MNGKIRLPDALINAGVSLERNIFRYRSDRDFIIKDNGRAVSKNLIVDEIENHSLWHSAVGALNDPFEIYARRNFNEFNEMSQGQKMSLWARVATRLGQPALMALSNEYLYKAYKFDEERLRKTVDDVYKDDTSFDEFIDEIRETLGIACFTSICDSRLMWGYYCNGLSGVCLIYNKERLDEQGIELNQVKYLDGPFEINILDFVYHYQDARRAKTLSQIVKTKHSEWEHEVESRSVVELRENEIGRGRLMQMQSSSLDGIIIGRNVRGEIKDKIMHLSEEQGFKIFSADVDYQLFGVKIT